MMYTLSKFSWHEEQPDEIEVEEWAQTFFFNIMNILNSFFVHVEVKEAAERFAAIDLEPLVREQLEGEKNQVIDIALANVKELYETELDFLKSYAQE